MKSTVEDLLARVNIVDIISQHVKLRRTGKNFVGLCPFHKEKTASFTVSTEKQIYYCFGCHQGGNAINFLMKYENLTFQEALENLGRQYGVHVVPRSGEKRTSTLQALTKLAEYYHQQLRASSRAQEYLAARGIEKRMIEEFRLGYSDRFKGDIQGFLKRAGIPNDILLSTGVVRLKDGDMYDMFRGRIIIPIFDVNSRVIGFGARALEPDVMPKYINSPESAIFSKRTALYGIDKTRKFITEANEAYIVEGYFDLISLFQHGVRNAVATLGTAITENQLSRLRNYTENITLMLDGDEAGITSALRLIAVFSDMDIHGHMIVLPSKHDPDSFVRKEGTEGLQKVMAGRKSILEYFFEYAKKKYGVDKLEGKMAFVKAVMPHIETIRDGIKKRLYVKRLAELVGVEEHHVWTGIRETPRSMPVEEDSSRSVIGRRIIGIVLGNPQFMKMCREKKILEYMQDSAAKEILKKILRYVDTGTELAVSTFVDEIEDGPTRELVLSALLESDEYGEAENEKIMVDFFRHLERKFMIDESRHITEQLVAAEKAGDQKKIMDLLERKRQLMDIMKSHTVDKDEPIGSA